MEYVCKEMVKSFCGSEIGGIILNVYLMNLWSAITFTAYANTNYESKCRTCMERQSTQAAVCACLCVTQPCLVAGAGSFSHA